MKIVTVVIGSAAMLLSTTLCANTDNIQAQRQQQSESFKQDSYAKRPTMRAGEKFEQGIRKPTATPFATDLRKTKKRK